MIYTSSFKEIFSEHIAWLNTLAELQNESLAYVDEFGNILGCNESLLKELQVQSIKNINNIERWIYPAENDIYDMLGEPGIYKGKIAVLGESKEVTIHSQKMPIRISNVVALVIHNVSAMNKAIAAEKYYEHLRKQFLVNISHEFRTPMNAIIGFTDLMKNTKLTLTQSDYITMTGQSASSMMRKIENLLELLQAESDETKASSALFNPIEVFENFARQFADFVENKPITLMFLIDPNLPKAIRGDRDKLFVVLRNLLQNAIQYTEKEGNILVEIRILQQDDCSMIVEYGINDTGIGIEPDRATVLLRPFASASEKQRYGHDGLGIGLSLSHKYVGMMGSKLMLASKKGQGSRFSFRINHPVERFDHMDISKALRVSVYTQELLLSSQVALLYKYLELFGVETTMMHDLVNDALHECDVLFLDVEHLSITQIDSLRATYPYLKIVPLIQSNSVLKSKPIFRSVDSVINLPILPSLIRRALSSAKQPILREISIENLVPRNVKILVAEDNIINLKLLETILEQENYYVVAVENGQKAVDAYLKEHFDLVLMDIDMPIMDGLTANRLIKEIDKRNAQKYVPVIALTAHALSGDRQRILEAGLDAHLPKPIDKHYLLQTIERFLQKDENENFV